MLPYPLTRPNRLRLALAFAGVPRVDISIDCIVEDQMGKAFVDATDNPQFFLVEQDQFFSYLAGDFSKPAGYEFVRNIPHGRFLMAGSQAWHDVVQEVYGEQLKPVQRYSYSSESLSSDSLYRLAAANPQTPNVQRINTELANRGMPYLEIGAFDSPDDFIERGIGFCMIRDDKSIGIAYSSLVCAHAIEVSIVVDEQFRQQGIATALSCQLLLWCLDHHLAPHWDAANPLSCRLAEKLGYKKAGEYTAYYLK